MYFHCILIYFNKSHHFQSEQEKKPRHVAINNKERHHIPSYILSYKIVVILIQTRQSRPKCSIKLRP